MKNLSSETLFHFVSKKEYLFDILVNNFRPRYVEESITFESDDLNRVGIPMLCFCDIRLSEVKDHVEWYGNYGIGMRSSWAISKGLTPVQYYNKDSHLIKSFSKGLKSARKSFPKLGKGELVYSETPDWYFEICNHVWFMKEFRGKQFHRTDQKDKFKKFYDEREWRYVPPLKELKKLPDGLPMSIGKEKLNEFNTDEVYRLNLNRKLGEATQLKFEPNDIAYIIIANEDERLEIIHKIKEAKDRNFSEDEVVILSSKILSIEQIKSDF